MKPSRTPPPAARVPFWTVFASIVGLWATYFALITVRAELLGLPFLDEMLWLRLLTTFCGILITLGLWLVLRVFDAQPMWLKIGAALLLAMPAALLTAQANALIFGELQAAVDGMKLAQQGFGDDTLMVDQQDVALATERERLIDFATSRYFLLLAWCALYLALLTGERARAAERREQEFRTAAKAAELRSLRYQVNPHFLFNTLNSLSAMVLTGKTEAAERMIQTISTFYRRSLADDPTSDVPLRNEIALQQLYLEIEAVRFPARLRTIYEIPPALENALVPGMILQPLVENSVKHAVSPSGGEITITLAAREEYGRLVITVSDNGTGGGTGGGAANHAPGHGIGLANVRERLQARFGEEASVVSGLVPGGYATHLRVPILTRGRT
ncbi:sensor histidine kinase [Aurantiacibacter xanthus]|uniref:Sensor histidine kinase n=1 Tax=Aurantiacibacter xanthus TaxID=1784712 RepID=A0A3A1PGX4_9SPHN|nr:histidine kinase [Aurantiacibacter xanthus]RIV92328.1 sensor histidine kinase [Aurantiacibacter xanthus]